MANPFPFVANTVLTAAQLNGIGEATTWTPTYTNFSLGNGTVTARYVRANKLIFAYFVITCGTTSAFTGTQMQISLPITANTSSTLSILGGANIYDASSGAQYLGVIQYVGSATSVAVQLFGTASTYGSIAYTNATTPITLATGDLIVGNLVYEAA
jgi:hypothetical protein